MNPPASHEAVEALFALAIETPASARAAVLDEHAAATPAVRSEVEALLQAHESAGGFLLTPPRSAGRIEPETRAPGERFGAYEIVNLIGAGGMGAVYRARRSDEQFDKVVAIKVLHRWISSPSLRERFERERRLLAQLEHPGIAMLLDAGVTDDGEPYLVMEHVEGRSLLEHAEGLRLTQRLRLFIDVCEAVDAAHRRFIAHLDLKPRNILVTSEGRVKLVDFGIARLVESDRAGAEIDPLGTVFTPAYASPEQRRGEIATASSDVYALGTVLRELVTGRRPSDEDRAAPPSAAVSADDPSLASRLRGDLDAIVLKATRNAPGERYGSAHALASDLRRVLAHEPVEARPHTVGYLARRFARRRRGPLAATGLMALLLAVGAAGVLWQAGVARAERDRAEQRFGELRQLTNHLLTDVSARLENIPGAVGARREIVRSASAYLDSLAKDAGGDPALLLELAEGHDQLGRLQRSMISSDTGDSAAALERHSRALALRRQAAELLPKSADARLGIANSLILIGDMLRASGRLDESIERYAESERAFAEAGGPDELDRLHRRAVVLTKIGIAESRRGRRPEAASAYREALGLNLQVLDREPTRLITLRNTAVSYEKLGDIEEWRERPREAFELYGRALEIHRRLRDLEPEDARHLYAAAVVHSKLGEVLGHPAYANLGDAEGALREYERGRSLIEPLLEDADDARARATVAFFDRRIGTFLSMLGRHDEALEHQISAHDEATRLARENPTDVRARLDEAASGVTIADTLDAMGAVADSLAWRLRAIAGLRGVLELSPEDINAKAELAVSLRRACESLIMSDGQLASELDPRDLLTESLVLFEELAESGVLSDSLAAERELASELLAMRHGDEAQGFNP
jgi:eukaryotic-like serine/threonine-protein kinase